MSQPTDPSFEAILFDLDDTLIPEMASEREALLAACRLAGVRGIDAIALAESLSERAGELWGAWGKADYYRSIGYSRWEGLWGPLNAADRGLGDLAEHLPDYRERAWSMALADHGVRDDELRNRIISAHRVEREARLVPFEDTVPALRDLDDRYRLALVTNGAPAVQRMKAEKAGLADCFEFVSVSGEVGAGKPDPRMFMSALDALRVRPERAVMVGNNSAADIAGAKALGIYAVWINRTGGEPRVVEPDAEIRTLDELAPLLARPRPTPP